MDMIWQHPTFITGLLKMLAALILIIPGSACLLITNTYAVLLGLLAISIALIVGAWGYDQASVTVRRFSRRVSPEEHLSKVQSNE